ncbi:large ribosomal subunit protein mL50 isoform X1 [Petromyzon marinus]|uniref:large ribosomal subunit protein mL50 isoform X1 n=2 Tax=Petromyzon marinus TaxID=7757 RepID=UPI003F717423
MSAAGFKAATAVAGAATTEAAAAGIQRAMATLVAARRGASLLGSRLPWSPAAAAAAYATETRGAFWSRINFLRRDKAAAVPASAPAEEQERQRQAVVLVPRPEPRSRRYDPPADLEQRVRRAVGEVYGAGDGAGDAAGSGARDWRHVAVGAGAKKFELLARLAADLGGHRVPNSRLHEVSKAGDVLAFYGEAVRDSSRFEDLASMPLPPNLKIRWEESRGE